MMKLIKDLGMVQVSGKIKRRIGVYECSDCKRHFEARTGNVKARNQERCSSCASKLRATKHGLKYTRLNSIWRSMKNRTLSPNYTQYNDYGGRGITICDEWKNDFMSFYNWALSNGYEENKGLSIDRIDNDENYEPNNCRWTTQNIQARNQRIRKNNKSGYRGVCYHKGNNKYTAQIKVNYKRIHLGSFKTPVEGAIAYNNYIIENNLEGFILNEIPEEHINDKSLLKK